MFEISVETHFYASHELELGDGLKEPSHFHDWSVTAEVSSENLNNIGIVMNFHKLKELLENITLKFNKKNLNKIKYFQKINPTAENVAQFIFDKLQPQLPENVKLSGISVIEEAGCIAKYRRQVKPV